MSDQRHSEEGLGDLTSRQEATIRELHATAPELSSELGLLVLRRGLGVLDQPIPYLIIALRNTRTDETRKAEVRQRAERLAAREPAPFSESDPAELLLGGNELSRAVEAMNALPVEDAAALWWHAEGYSDQQISQLWTDAGFEPANPTLAALRKRRSRARAALRASMSSEPTDT